MRFVTAFHYSRWSMKQKLFGYMLVLVLLLLLVLIMGLLLFGHFNRTNKSTYEALDVQSEHFEKDVFTHFNRLAAAGIELSRDTTSQLEAFLTENDKTFSELDNDKKSISALQNNMLDSLQQRLRQENCSGVFVMLDITINNTVTDAAHSRTGLYLQQSGYKTQDKSILLYRGLADIGKQHGMILHQKWRQEFRTDHISNYDDIVPLQEQDPAKAYLLTDRFTLPETAEDVMLIVTPIIGSDGTYYGLCGYEVSAGYFKAYHAQPTKIAHLTCLLTEQNDSSIDASAGLSCGGANEYFQEPKGALSIGITHNNLVHFTNEDASYIGVTRTISLSPNNPPYTLAVMMQKSDYDRAVMKSVLQNMVFWALILFFAVTCCLFFSRRYLSPILKDLEQIKSDHRCDAQSSIPEINDLFAFLAEQDRQYESSLNALERKTQTVQSENLRLQIEYEQAQNIFEKAQADYIKAQNDLSNAKKELDRLAYSRKNEIDPDDYQHFLAGIQNLTKTEREVFDWYLEGKSANEILLLTGIKEGTLKFHNHNILQKLGVSSRKQMLRFAALMQHENQEETNI